MRSHLRFPRVARAFLFGTALALALLTTAAAQWNTQAPVPTFLDVRGVGAPTASRVFLGTDDDSWDTSGALWESTDGGVTWTQRDVPFSLGDPLNGLFFRDALNGWAFGNVNYRTTDGGTTWTELPLLGSAYFMDFYTPTFGLTTGNFGSQVSLDGGTTWQAAPNGETAFDFADNVLGLGAGPAGISRTTDGGVTFAVVDVVPTDAIAFLSSAVAVGIQDSTFVRSGDGGLTWTQGASADGRRSLFAVDASIVLAWGRGGTWPNYDDRVFRSSDGGVTWSDLGEPMPDGVLAIVASSASVLVGADLSGNLHHSTDGGQTWSQVFTSPGILPGFLSSARPAFADATTGYYGYGPGFVVKTTDGGASWFQISSGSGNSVNDLARFPNGDLIAVAENGTAMVSAAGLGPWTILPRFTSNHLTGVQVLGAQEIVVVDDAGFVYRSADAGATWTAGASSSGTDGEDLDFTTLLDGWVIGFNSGGNSAYHTTDGGDTWTAVPDFSGAYVAIDFEGASGWAANVGGLFYRTTDDGATWTSGNLPGSPLQIQDMDFWDGTRGYAVGWWGFAAATTDGGLTWQALPTPNTTDQLTDIHLVGPNELWVSTNSDAAYYSATGGQNWALLTAGSAGFGNFAAIVADTAGNAWMAGFQGYTEHFTGPPPAPLNQPPAASFDFAPTGLSVSFTDTSTDPDGSVVAWDWDFGDGTTSTQQHPTHVYASANTYWVTLVVTDDDGDTGGAAKAVVAQPGPGGTFGDFTEVTPLDSLFVNGQNEDFWIATSASADYDGDGDLDIAVFGYWVVYFQGVQERLILLRNDGEISPTEWDFTYVDLPLGTLYSGASDMAFGDVDGDGDQDLVVGSEGQTVIYRNDLGTLVMTDTVLPGYWEDNFQADFDLRSITWADYDNDGDQDLLLPSVFDDSTFTYRTALMRNDGPNGTGGWLFTEETAAGLAATTHAQSAWADFDGDQDLDLLLVHLAPLTNNGFIRRYRNDGGGSFFAEDILDSLTIEHGEAQWADYDSDGDLDILVAGHIKELTGTFTYALRIYRNDAETYVPIDILPCPSCDGWVDLNAATWADYDSDGAFDILLAGTYNSGSQIEGRARIYSDSAGVFVDSGNELPAPRSAGSRGGSFTWMDLDGDGDLDYFIAGEYFVPGGNGLVEAQMHAYRNDTAGSNAAPGSPSGLVAVPGQTAGSVALSWQAAADDLTPPAAITYDLEVRLNATPVSAPRRLPEPGNVSAVTQWALTGLANGVYTWSVRAVDSAYNGGPVAQGTFGVGVPVDVATTPGLPAAFQLLPGSPNPFASGTSLRFALPERSAVRLAVFDVAGRRVADLVDGWRDPGIHEVRWEPEQAATGIYFVRLETPGFTQTRRVLRLK